MIFNFYPILKKKPTTTPILEHPQGYSFPFHPIIYLPNLDILNSIILETMTFQDHSNTPLSLQDLHQQPILNVITLTFQCNKILETKVYTTSFFFMSVLKNANYILNKHNKLIKIPIKIDINT
jgi:hypothetical protein